MSGMIFRMFDHNRFELNGSHVMGSGTHLTNEQKLLLKIRYRYVSAMLLRLSARAGILKFRSS